MNSIAYISQIDKINALIECKEAEIANLYDVATSITAAMKDDCVQHSDVSDKVGNSVAKITDLQNELQLEIERYKVVRTEIFNSISQLEPQEMKVLYKRYFQKKSVTKIAEEMNYSRQNISIIHKKALKNLQKIIN